MITLNQFKKVDLRVGTIIGVKEFLTANQPAYQLTIDFGGFGIRYSSAPISNYSIESLINKQIVAVVNSPPKQMSSFTSDVLILRAKGKNGDILLLEPDSPVRNGAKIS